MNILGKSINKVFLIVTMLVMVQCCCCVIPIRWRIRAPRFTTAPPQAVQQVNTAALTDEDLPVGPAEAGLLRGEDLAQPWSGETASALFMDRTEADNTSIAGVASARKLTDSVRITKLQNINIR